MKLRNTAIALGVSVATALGLSLLKVNKPIVIGSTFVVTSAGFILSRRNKGKKDIEYQLTEEEWEYVEILRNYDEKLSQEEWQEKYAIRTKKDWKKLEKELNKEWKEMWSRKPPTKLELIEESKRELSDNSDPLEKIKLPEFDCSFSSVSWKDLGLSVRCSNILIRTGFNTLTDISGLRFTSFLEIKNMGSKAAGELFYVLNKKGFIPHQLISDLDAAYPELREQCNDLINKEKTDLEDLAKELQELFENLLGGHEEYLKVMDWQRENLALLEVQQFQKSLKSNSCFRMLYALGKLAFKYDELNDNKTRELGDPEVQNMLKYKRHIRAVGKEDSIDFAFTLGNCVQNIPVPELLSFYPGQKTISSLFNSISELLINETIKPLMQGEIREVRGILGQSGQMPIRLRLLNKNEKEESREKWTCGLPADSEIILVDVPDTNGYFANEPESYQYTRKTFPKSLWTNSSTTSLTNFNLRGNEAHPCSLDAFYICLSQNTNYLRYVDPSDKDLNKVSNWATIVILLVIAEEIEIGISKVDIVIEKDLLEKIKDIYYSVSVVKTLKEWVSLKLKSSDNEQLESTWCIGENKFVSYCRYQNIDSFLNDVEWGVISNIISSSWENSISKKETAKLREAKLAWEKQESDIDSEDKEKLDVVFNGNNQQYVLSKEAKGNYESKPLTGEALLTKLKCTKEDSDIWTILERCSHCHYEIEGDNYEVDYEAFLEAVVKAKGVQLSDIKIKAYSEIQLIVLAYDLAKHVKMSALYQYIVTELIKQKVEITKAFAISKRLDLKVQYGQIIETDYITNYISEDNSDDEAEARLVGNELINKISEYKEGENYDLDIIEECRYFAYDNGGNELVSPFEFLCAVSEFKNIKAEDVDISGFNLEELARKVERELNGKQKYDYVDFIAYADIDELEFYALCKNFKFQVDVLEVKESPDGCIS